MNVKLERSVFNIRIIFKMPLAPHIQPEPSPSLSQKKLNKTGALLLIPFA